MLSSIRRVHDATIARYRSLGMSNSTIGWILFTEGLFVLFVGKAIVELIFFNFHTT